MTLPPPDRVRRVVYLGTPELAVPPLRALHSAGYEIPLVVSRPDARRGRGGAAQPSPVKAAAAELGLPVTDDLADVAEADADLGVVVAYGRIIPTSLLEQLPFVNIHFSLLPRWRGAAPVERAILAGDSHTGVCLMALEAELDSGAVYRRDEVEIDPDETLEELRARLVDIGTHQLLEALAEGLGEAVDQEGEPIYAAKLTAADREIDWSSPAVAIHRQVRVGGAFTTFRGKRVKIHRARVSDAAAVGEPGSIDGVDVATGVGTIELVEVQAEGKPRRPAKQWVNGARPGAADRLGQ